MQATVAAVQPVAAVTVVDAVATVEAVQPTATVQAALLVGSGVSDTSGRYPFLRHAFGMSDTLDSIVIGRDRAEEDTLVLGETMSWDIEKFLVDSFTLSEALDRFAGDSVTILDITLIVLDRAMALADSFSLADSEPLIGDHQIVPLADTATMLESLAVVLSKGLTDSLGLTEQLAASLSKLAADTTVVTDGVAAFALSRQIAETVTLAEAVAKAVASPRTETATATDAGSLFVQNYAASDYFASDYVASATRTF